MMTTLEKLHALNSIMRMESKVTPSLLRLSTMTIFTYMKVPTNYNLNKIIELYLENDVKDLENIIGHDIHVVFPMRRSRTTSRGKCLNNFFNQLTFWYKDGTKKSVKLFINGNVHITGCRSLREYVILISKIAQFINKVFDTDTQEDDACIIQDVDIQMANTNFGVNVGLDLSKLKRILLENGRIATYDREVYPGLNLKVPTSFKREASVLVFISGNVIITGVKHFLEIFEAYKYITDAIICNMNEVVRVRLQTQEKVNKKSEITYNMGYDQHLLGSIIVWD